jgi:hypothetical protein
VCNPRFHWLVWDAVVYLVTEAIRSIIYRQEYLLIPLVIDYDSIPTSVLLDVLT